MFKMLVFLIAAPTILQISWLGLVFVSSGDLAGGLPFASIALMSASYLVSGATETSRYLRGLLK